MRLFRKPQSTWVVSVILMALIAGILLYGFTPLITSMLSD